MIGRKDNNGPQYGTGVNEEIAPCLNTTDIHAVCHVFKERGGKPGGGKGYLGSDELAFTLSRNQDQNIMHTVYDTTQITSPQNGSNPQPGDPSTPLVKNGHVPVLVDNGNDRIADTLTIGANQTTGTSTSTSTDIALQDAVLVRRLTPLECERLQGFPDGYTDIPYVMKNRRKPKTLMGKIAKKDSNDSRRYAALGNSMTVPVMRWIGERIQAVEDELLNIELMS